MLHKALGRWTDPQRRSRISSRVMNLRPRMPRALTTAFGAVAKVASYLWRIPLIVAGASMLIAGILHSNGSQRASEILVTAAMAVAMTGVPVGLLALAAPEPAPEGSQATHVAPLKSPRFPQDSPRPTWTHLRTMFIPKRAHFTSRKFTHQTPPV